jgi:D-serine deaminase-like pyridoxal phosphate-dependent protein
MISNVPSLSVPTLLIDKEQCRQNIRSMAEKAHRNQLVFRPHFKTHQSEVVGTLFKEEGISCITVSTLRMANEFAKQGWKDITVAFPANILEMDLINHLAQRITLNLVVESIEVADFLNHHLQHPVSVFIKMDTGYHRTGMAPNNSEAINQLINVTEKPSSKLHFKGFLVHAGHSYKAHGTKELDQIHHDSLAQLQKLGTDYSETYPNLLISMGDTPTCSTQENFEGVDEIRPGNFVYYDATQLFIGSCQLNQVAAYMACPVVAKHPERNELVLYGGAVHFSKDSLLHPIYGLCYGLMAEFTSTGVELIPNCFIKNISQEHGIASVTSEYLQTKKPGDIIYAIPVHSCLTANLMKNDTQFI